MKRSTPSDSEDGNVEVPAGKRRRIEADVPFRLLLEDERKENLSRVKTFEDDPHELLERSIALVLQHVGFQAASKEAMESFCAQVDTYATHFLSKITSSMLNARRSQPTPVDFQYGLAGFDLPILSLEPHLKPPIPKSKSQIRLEALPPQDLTFNDITKLIGNDLSGEQDKLHMPHIPKRFPSFPSKHTYKWTEKESDRERDPRKIREEAAKAARQGEEALRKLTKVGKSGQEKDIKNAASKDMKSKQRHNMWEHTMKDLLAGKRDAATEGNKAVEEADRSMIVNADRSYGRKGPPAKRKAPPPELLLALKI